MGVLVHAAQQARRADGENAVGREIGTALSCPPPNPWSV